MTFSPVTPITAGVPVSKATFFDPVATDLNLLGGAWTPDARASTAIWTNAGASLGNGTLVSQYRLIGKTLDWLVLLTFGSTTSGGSGQFTLVYPAGVQPLNPGAPVALRLFDSSGPTTYLGMGVVNLATVNLDCITAAVGSLSTVTATSPMTWGTGDVAALLLTGCEVA